MPCHPLNSLDRASPNGQVVFVLRQYTADDITNDVIQFNIKCEAIFHHLRPFGSIASHRGSLVVHCPRFTDVAGKIFACYLPIAFRVHQHAFHIEYNGYVRRLFLIKDLQ